MRCNSCGKGMVFLTFSVCFSMMDTMHLQLASYANICFTDLPGIRAVCKRQKGRKYKKIRQMAKIME